MSSHVSPIERHSQYLTIRGRARMQPSRRSAGGQCGAKSGRAEAVGPGTGGECATTTERAMLGVYLRGGTAAGEREGNDTFWRTFWLDFCSVTMSRAICSCTAASRSTMRRTTATSLTTVSSWCCSCSSADDSSATDTCADGRTGAACRRLYPEWVRDLTFWKPV